ncbi:MAG: sigma-54-dependent transcriptional regulator [Planctomycetota bacterium]
MGQLVYVVDDKSAMREPVMETLSLAGYDVKGFSGVDAALEACAKSAPDLVLTDLSMPGKSGIDLMRELSSGFPGLPVVLMTAYASVETAVEAMKAGAADYITKPVGVDELELTIARVLETGRLRKENRLLKETLARCDSEVSMVGSSPAMARVRRELPLIAASPCTVLVLGESGTGKEVLAREIHRLSPRSRQRFLAVNCAALSAGLLESELFGHEKGSFTGAAECRKGRFEMADKGTLLLDEVTEMDIHLQAKLLRVLQERVIEKVGSSEPIPVDVRVIATSNRNMDEAVKQGKLREDLYYRLNVVNLSLPPLRDRLEDIPDLVQHFASRHGGSVGMTDSVLEKMRAHDWPGNVRELENLVQRAIVLGSPEALVPRVRPRREREADEPSEDALNGMTLDEMNRQAVIRTLRRFNGQKLQTARQLGISDRTLREWLKKWEVS